MGGKLGGFILISSLIVAGIRAQNLNLNMSLPQPGKLGSPTLPQSLPAKTASSQTKERKNPEDAALATLYPQVLDLKNYIRDLKRNIEVLEIQRGLLETNSRSPIIRQELGSIESQIDADAMAISNFKEELTRSEKSLSDHLKATLSHSATKAKDRYHLLLSALGEKTSDMRNKIRSLERETRNLQDQLLKLGGHPNSHTSVLDQGIILLEAKIHANKTAIRSFQQDLSETEKTQDQFQGSSR